MIHRVNDSYHEKKVWGSEEIIVNNDMYAGKILHIDRNAISSYHCHKVKHETFYCLYGRVELNIDGETILLLPQEFISIEPGVYHSFKGMLYRNAMIEFSTHDESEDNYRLTKSRRNCNENVSW